MSESEFARGQVAITGFGLSPGVKRSSMPLGALAMQASLDAIADAGLKPSDIDGICTSPLLPSVGAHSLVDGLQVVTSQWLHQQLGIEVRWLSGFSGYGTLPGAVIQAVNAIISGAARHVLLFRALANPVGTYNDNDLSKVAGDHQWTATQGIWGPAEMMAFAYNDYLQRYGARRETLGKIVTQIRANAQMIPGACMHGQPLSLDQYMEARLIADPICLLDCDMPVDGVGAFVLSSTERARDMPNRPVCFAGFGQGNSRHPGFVMADIEGEGLAMANRLWRSAGLSVQDLDVIELYDGFAHFVYYWLEALGFCGPGEAHQLIDSTRIDPEGPLPLISSAGALGNGRMHGIPQLLECYLQLSRRAGDRQRDRAEVGIACHSMPHMGAAIIMTSGAG